MRNDGSTSASRPGRWAAIALVLGIAFHLAFLASLPTGFLNPLYIEASEGLGQASDFFGIYQAGANFVRGYSIYDSDDYHHQAPLAVPFFYYYRYLPPTAIVAGLGYLLFRPWTAYWVWVGICEILYLSVVLSLLRGRQWPKQRRYLLAGLWLGFFPFYLEQVMGQFSVIMTVLLWILWRCEDHPVESVEAAPENTPGGNRHEDRGKSLRARLREVADGWRAYRWRADRPGRLPLVLSWSGGVALKSFPYLLVFPFLRDRRLKLVLGGTLLTTAVCLPYYLVRPPDLREFLRLNFTPFAPRMHKGSLGFHTLARDVASHLPFGLSLRHLRIGAFDATVSGSLLMVAFAAIVLLALLATLRLHRHPHRSALDLALWTSAFMLIFKSVWEYHYIMLLPAISALYLRLGSRTVLILGLLLGLPTLYAATPLLAGVAAAAPLTQWPRWYQFLHFSTKSLPTLALFLWCVRRSGLVRDSS